MDKPEILDLGPLCGATAVALADRGARVTVQELELPERPPDKDDADAPAPRPVRIEHPDGRFHLVLAWELFDFTPPERLPELGAEIARVMAEGGWLLLFSRNQPARGKPAPDPRCRFRLLPDDRLVREQTGVPERPRWSHSTRDLERALKPLKVQGIHLQRDQMRELLASKDPAQRKAG